VGTLNGLYAEHGGQRVKTLPLAKDPGLRIGRTTLRVRDARRPVAPEKLLTPPRAHARWAGLLGAVLILLLGFLFSVVSSRITGLIGSGFIVWAFCDSIRYNRRERGA